MQEAELLLSIQHGEKLLNAYIYAVAEEGADIDSELFNLERISKQSFDLFSPPLSFEHNPDLQHQNYLTRASIL